MKWNLIKNADWISFDSLSLSPRCLCCCCCSSTWEMSKIEKEKSFHFLLCCCLLLGRLCMREGGGWDEPVSSAKIQVELEFFFLLLWRAAALRAGSKRSRARRVHGFFFVWFFSSSQRLSGWGPEKIMKWIYFSSSSLARLPAPLQSALLHVVWVKKTTQKKWKKSDIVKSQWLGYRFLFVRCFMAFCARLEATLTRVESARNFATRHKSLFRNCTNFTLHIAHLSSSPARYLISSESISRDSLQPK